MIRSKNAASKKCFSLTVLLFLLVSSTFIYADQKDLDEIRHAINVKGARWHADKTSISVLSEKEKRMRLGNREDEDILAQALSSPESAPIPQMEGAPVTLDWRNIGAVSAVSYVSPVKNQGSCGSCWAFATTAGLESQVMISGGGIPIDLSEQILVSCSGVGSCSGGSSSSASSYIRDVGLPLESCFKYTATNNLCSSACLDWKNNTYSIKGWHTAGTTVDSIRSALYTYGPIVAAMHVYNDFTSYRSGVYSYTTGSYLGAHAVLVVGYDDTQQAFIVKNSWGSGWGEAGYFMIAYSEVGGTSRFAYSTMAYDGYGDSPIPEPDPDPAPTPCTYSLSSTGATFKAGGGAGRFTMYATGSCSLTSVTPVFNADWVTRTSISTGSSSMTVGYAVAANSGPARSATISIGGLNYTVKQLQAGRTHTGRRK
jgi:C1A family cysteine protease